MAKNSLNNNIDSVSLKEFFQGQINDVKQTFQSIHEESYKQHLTRHQEILDTIKDKTKDIPEMKNKTDKMYDDMYGDQLSGVTGIKKKVNDLWIWKVSIVAVASFLTLGGSAGVYFMARAIITSMVDETMSSTVQQAVDKILTERAVIYKN